jgi:predicted DNA-binding ribbon-helix-helix protein
MRVSVASVAAAAICEEAEMNSSVKKRSIVIGSHKTSISLEDIFWTSLKEIARQRETSLPKLMSILDAGRKDGNLSSTIRVFVLNHYLNKRRTVLPVTGEGQNLPVIDISLTD